MEHFALAGPTEWAVLLAMLVALGTVAGFMAGLLGVGGGVILVPGIFYLFTLLGFDSPHLMHIAVGTSLAVIVPTGFSSARAHHKRNSVRFDLVKAIGLGIVVGVAAGTVMADYLSGESLKIIFAVAITVLAGIMLADPSRFNVFDSVPPQPLPGLAGIFIGFLSTLIGIGGATLSVPAMSLCKVPIREAIGTASALGLAISIPAAAGFILIGLGESGLPPWSLGFVSLPAWLAIAPASILAARGGAWAVHRIPVLLMRRVFAIFMTLLALSLIVEMI